MALPNTGTLLRGSGLDQSIWKIEWTYTDGSGAVLLANAQSDRDERVATPVADGGTGLTLIKFPKCKRVWVLDCSVNVPTPGTSERLPRPGSIDAAAGSLTFVML